VYYEILLFDILTKLNVLFQGVAKPINVPNILQLHVMFIMNLSGNEMVFIATLLELRITLH